MPVSLLRLSPVLLLLIWLQDGVDAVRCFCDNRNCEDALCDGSWCLVGFQTDVRLVQNCGTYSASALKDCAENWNGWEEVCSCQEDFCNTFSHLRAKMKQLRGRRNDDGSRNPHDSYDSGVAAPPNYPYQSNQLILLLVVIPLGVGALAVCLVFVNYHCKMC